MPLPPRSPLPPTRAPLFPTPPPRRRFNRVAFWLAIGLALLVLPFTYQYQNRRTQEIRVRHEAAHPTPPRTVEETGDMSQPAELRRWHMQGLDGITEAQARTRFGKPIFARDYNLTYGTFLGPEYGLKHYYLNESPEFDARRKEAAVAWTFPEYTTIREMIWKLHESYLTLWLHEPRVEISLQHGTADAVFPRTASGEWVVIDNYRVGQDLVKAPPMSAGQAMTPPGSP